VALRQVYCPAYPLLSGYLSQYHFHKLNSSRRSNACLEGKGEKLSGLFCAILCATIVHSAMLTHMNRLTVLWIGFCLTRPISLCLDSFLYCVLLCVVCMLMLRFVTR